MITVFVTIFHFTGSTSQRGVYCDNWGISGCEISKTKVLTCTVYGHVRVASMLLCVYQRNLYLEQSNCPSQMIQLGQFYLSLEICPFKINSRTTGCLRFLIQKTWFWELLANLAWVYSETLFRKIASTMWFKMQWCHEASSLNCNSFSHLYKGTDPVWRNIF